MERYLARHPEYGAGSDGVRRFLTTGRAGSQNGLVERFWGAPVAFEADQAAERAVSSGR